MRRFRSPPPSPGGDGLAALRPVIVTLILATAFVNNKIAVTGNVKDFAGTGVAIVNPRAIAG